MMYIKQTIKSLFIVLVIFIFNPKVRVFLKKRLCFGNDAKSRGISIMALINANRVKVTQSIFCFVQ